MIIDRFRAQLDEIAAYIALAEQRGDGVQVVLTAEAKGAVKQPKVTAYGALVAQGRKQV